MAKKIGIVTHYGVHNHGAQLQLYALLKILRSRGYSANALQFKKDYRFMDSEAEKKYSVSLKSVPFYLKYFKANGLKKTFFNIKKKQIFDSFRQMNNVLGEKYEDFNGDLIIIGSDEVFSFETGVTDAFWGRNTKCKNIAAYSASFGPTNLQEICDKGLEDYVKQSVNNFICASARDVNTKKILENLWNKTIPLTCDPVILYGYKNEISAFQKTSQKYILLYSYDKNMNTAEEISMIRNIAQKLSLPIYSVGFYHSWCDKNFNASPLELLGWFKNAEYVVTDTFHGTVISLITESEFATFIRGNSNKLVNLLSEYGLEKRIFTDADNCLNILNSTIDYKTINCQLENYRQKSFEYLDSLLSKL